jgi:hypothetical protein
MRSRSNITIQIRHSPTAARFHGRPNKNRLRWLRPCQAKEWPAPIGIRHLKQILIVSGQILNQAEFDHAFFDRFFRSKITLGNYLLTSRSPKMRR